VAYILPPATNRNQLAGQLIGGIASVTTFRNRRAERQSRPRLRSSIVTRLLRVPVVAAIHDPVAAQETYVASRVEGWSCWKAMLMPQPPWLASWMTSIAARWRVGRRVLQRKDSDIGVRTMALSWRAPRSPTRKLRLQHASRSCYTTACCCDFCIVFGRF
jgi:hypothetical protein